MAQNYPSLRVGIIDYGMGNIQSVKNAFARLSVHVEIVQTPNELANCNALVLPGVGAFGKAMKNLEGSGMLQPIKKIVVEDKVPLLGICLGMQLLADHSEERGNYPGLSLIPGVVKKIPVSGELRLPHIGWNSVDIALSEPLFHGGTNGDTFYFVHSYYFECAPEYCSATTDYGHAVTASVQKGHVFGVQFHPEKSQTNGMRLLKGFIDYCQSSLNSQSAQAGSQHA
jgi:glutamine amidotransferase